jgi:type I restriction enzyme, S subunit
LKPKPGIDARYIYYALRAINLPDKGYSRHMRFLRASYFPICALGEQQRIVTKLDGMLARSTSIRDELDRVPKLVAQYKRAILKAAFSGEIILQDFSGYIRPISQIVRTLDQGWSPKCEDFSSASPEQWAIIKTTAVQPISFLPAENKVLPGSLTPRPRIQIAVGDVLITRAGPRSRVGITCVVKQSRPRLMLADKVYRLKLRDELADPTFVAFMLNSPQALRLIEKMKTGTSDSGLNLTQEKFLGLSIPIPSLPEQRAIVANVETAFHQIDQILAEVTRASALLDRLDKATLAKAFRGELVAPHMTATAEVMAAAE